MAKFEYPELLKKMVEKRFVNVQKHSRYPLWLYNYSKRAQHRDMWNEATVACRGMIMDRDLNIVSRPFKKFFNYWESATEKNMPDEPFVVTEKIDGSLGISYCYEGVWGIATRGSFEGKQAMRANRMLHEKYRKCLPKMRPELTYLFEIIYPENRIIVDYGDREELVLLAVIDTETGVEIVDYEYIGFPKLKTYDINSFEDVIKLKETGADNAEGVVMRFASGLRLKVKFEGYMRLHSIMLGMTGIKVWNYISKGNDIDRLYDLSTEEQKYWLQRTSQRILADYCAVKQQITDEFHALSCFTSKKEAAEFIAGREHEAILFALLNDKPVEKMLWQMVKPEESDSWFAERG
ncbi:MAG: T4 RnlA family RNA ligase [Prevotellaceae bacterium]|jgi:RNA ligase|nr:T4 RnlA family RNA ligase [Prevotellaceae bacterium]